MPTVCLDLGRPKTAAEGQLSYPGFGPLLWHPRTPSALILTVVFLQVGGQIIVIHNSCSVPDCFQRHSHKKRRDFSAQLV